MSIWEVIQNVQIENLKVRQRTGDLAAEDHLSRLRAREIRLNDRLDHLTLVTEAMWEMLSERQGITVAELAERVRALDAGQGKRTSGLDSEVRCNSCQAVIPATMQKCQFCGTPAPDATADPLRI
jgi:hypothetical protein